MKNRRLPKLTAALVAAFVTATVHAQGVESQPAPPPPTAPQKLDLPPIVAPPTGQRLPGKVIWFDLLTLEPDAARAFYAGVLGWTFTDRNGYLVATDGKTPVAGILTMPAAKPGAPAPQSRWMPLVSVADLSRAVAAVQKGGGKVLEGPGSLGARGRYAAVADPRGAQLVLVTAAGGDPVDADAPPPGWMWAELWTTDLKGSAAFYKSVVGYDTWQVGTGKQATWIYASGGRPRARASRMPFEKVPPQWLPYVVVKDLPGALAKVTELGGHVLRKPGAKGSQFAVVSDPGGAAFVLEQRPDQVAEDVAQAQLPAAGADAALAGAASAAGAAGPTGSADAFGIEAAEEKSRQEATAAAQAAAAGAVVEGVPGDNVVVAPAPYANVWIAPPAWGAYWGPGWAYPPGWVGAPWWGYPPVWGPGYAPPPYYPGRPGYYPGYRPPPPRPYPPGPRPPGPGGTRPPGTAPAPRPSSGGGSRPPSSGGGSHPSGSSSGGSHPGGHH